jgi:head-tail adaptor
MIAGRLKYKLTLFEPVQATNNFGEEDTTYQERRTVRAERVKQSGDRSEEVGEHFPDYRVEFNIREAHPVDENWRVQQLGANSIPLRTSYPTTKRAIRL